MEKKPRSSKAIDQKILNFSSSKNLISEGDSVLVAFSGGPDSVFLLDFFSRFKRKLGIRIAAMHVNHSIRGKESDGDEKFAVEFCGKLGIRIFSERVDVPAYSRSNKISIEEAARILRYKAIEEKAENAGFNKIATAHNLDDNAETILINLLSGTGIAGLAGIPVQRGKIIRPILTIHKKDILNCLGENGIDFRIDSSNLKTEFKRNFLRNKIFPLIREKINPSFEEALTRSSLNLSGALKFLEKSVGEGIKKFIRQEKSGIRLSTSLFDSAYSEIAGEILRKVMKEKFSHDFVHTDIEKLASLVSRQKGRKIKFSGKLEAVREQDSIFISDPRENSPSGEHEIINGGVFRIGDKTISVSEMPASKIKFVQDGKTEYVDADKLDYIFIFRKWKSGDRFIPLGMSDFKKVSDFLNDCKIPASEKKNRYVLLNRNQIVWVVGLRIDNRFKITDETKRVYKLWIA